jgi:hypothetical protein
MDRERLIDSNRCHLFYFRWYGDLLRPRHHPVLYHSSVPFLFLSSSRLPAFAVQQ